MSARDHAPSTVAATSVRSAPSLPQHTPGPWDYVTGRTLHHVETHIDNPHGAGRPVCSIPKAREADARLIAAAPDLLAACKKFRSAIDLLGDGPDDSDVAHAENMISEACVEARAAIAKAVQP